MPLNESQYSRRAALKTIGAAASAAAVPGATATFHDDTEAVLSDRVHEIRDEFDIRGVSIAVAPNNFGDGDVWAEAYGVDQDAPPTSGSYDNNLTTDHRLRLASVTKLLTSSAIIYAIDNGDLNYTDQVFGYDGLLSPSLWGEPATECGDFTVEDLLNHRYVAWENPGEQVNRPVYAVDNDDTVDYDDPVYATIKGVHEKYEIKNPGDWYYPRYNPPVYECGGSGEYMNYGFAVLGGIVEKVLAGTHENGDAFEWIVEQMILRHAGADGMDRTKSTERVVENEGLHHSQDGRVYTSSKVREKAWAWGGWAGSPTELARFGQFIMDDWVGRRADITDYQDLTSYGWNDKSSGGDDYVGHSGSQTGVRSALYCNPDRTVCVMMNTRHKDTWEEQLDTDGDGEADEDWPRERLLDAAFEFAEDRY